MDAKVKTLIDALLAKSRACEIEWRDTLFDESFQAAFSSGRVLVSSNLSTDAAISLAVDNADGRRLFSVSPQDAMDVDVEYEQKLEQLYELARGAVLRADPTLDNILQELGVSAHP